MSDDLSRPVSPSSCTSEDDSTRREFFASARVLASPTPTPVSETPKDFQLTSAPTGILTAESGIKTNPVPFAINCGPECRQPCCTISVQGWTTSKANVSQGGGSGGGVGQRSVDEKLEFAVGDGKCDDLHVHVPCSVPAPSSYPQEHDRVSVGSNDSGESADHLPGGEGRGETPLLPPDQQSGCGGRFTSKVSKFSL